MNTNSIQNLIPQKTQNSQIFPQINVPIQSNYNSQSVISQPINTYINTPSVQI